MARYEYIVTNPYNNQKTIVKASDKILLNERIHKLEDRWYKEYIRAKELQEKNELKEEAEEKTKNVQEQLIALDNILKATLSVNDVIEWKDLKHNDEFNKPEPILKDYLSKVNKYYGFESVFNFLKEKQEEQVVKFTQNFESDRGKFEEEKKQFEAEQRKHNKKIDDLKTSYENGEDKAVIEYLELVLDRSSYPDIINLDYKMHVVVESKLLILDLFLPNPKDLPTVVEYSFIASKKKIVEKELKEKELIKLYNDVIYKIVLRTVHEVFESDYSKRIDIIVLNGIVKGIDSKIGKKFENYILSLQVDRQTFEVIDLSNIEPKECFRYLKGISAGDLVQLAPVKPIMRLNMEDKRIIKADSVVDNYDETTNLATMDWKDFEVLVRDLIQKEFAREGCKVEVTRASKDAGVDAIAFDEDPIRGGKYVIQAKRYNNLVPLTAVRDLFGTVHNEGAVKGILITTSYYGKDALEFVKGKPLTLINGEELLYMFQKHGYKFNIELVKKKKAVTNEIY